ncbi:MAG: helicase IV [Candidatus Helarchaeota archaeon]
MENYIIWIIVGFLIFLILITYILIIINRIKGKKRVKRPSSYRCFDGDIVKSRAELIIDNLLNKLEIRHIYEKQIKINGRPLKCDWYLPEFDIYLEYWGLNSKNYLKRKAEKIKLYKKGNLKLISIEDTDLSDIYKNFPRKLSKYIDENLLKFIKHCPYCGKELDERF